MKVYQAGMSPSNVAFGKLNVREGYVREIKSMANKTGVDPDAMYACFKTIDEMSGSEDVNLTFSYIDNCREKESPKLLTVSLYKAEDKYENNKIADADFITDEDISNTDFISTIIKLIKSYNKCSPSIMSDNQAIASYIDEYAKMARIHGDAEDRPFFDFKA